MNPAAPVTRIFIFFLFSLFSCFVLLVPTSEVLPQFMLWWIVVVVDLLVVPLVLVEGWPTVIVERHVDTFAIHYKVGIAIWDMDVDDHVLIANRYPSHQSADPTIMNFFGIFQSSGKSWSLDSATYKLRTSTKLAPNKSKSPSRTLISSRRLIVSEMFILVRRSLFLPVMHDLDVLDAILVLQEGDQVRSLTTEMEFSSLIVLRSQGVF